ncbi:ESX-3 secretion system protein EccE3 [Mycobacterium simulans]|uniref:ESX-3 secretion system protein EccE3 n=1 Tax=Mycobacterium simulans TaxID=627089 RepID=A0A7Z7IS04_9MYCO|nr:type VII secretion protein EccE [Mycobacterium simulans]SOJ57514.1 ESX-3 secretion system protein EccE3 [Mycobacterium simulans]
MTLALLAVMTAVMAYPWPSTREHWVLGIAAISVIVSLGWWRGVHLTTILCRRVAMARRRRTARRHRRPVLPTSIDVKSTAVLRIRSLAAGVDVLSLPLIASYLNRYGIRADKIRITTRTTAAEIRETWVGLTISAADNLVALQARSSHIPLHQTTQVAARRLADHLQEIGWSACLAGSEGLHPWVNRTAYETWRGVVRQVHNGTGDYFAAYRVSVDDALPNTLAAIQSHPARETWTALEIAGNATGSTLAAACAFRTVERPDATAPLAGLIPQHGNHHRTLMALDTISTQRLDGHAGMADDVLARLRWPTVVGRRASQRG